MPDSVQPSSLHSARPAASESPSELHSFLRLALDKAWLIVACLVVALVAAIVYLKWTAPVYQAAAVVQVEQEDAKILKADQVISEDMRGLETMNTVAQRLSNPALVAEVLEANRLLPARETNSAGGAKGLTREQAIARFANGVKASLRRNTRLIDITVRDTDPRVAAHVANGLIERYLADDARAQLDATRSAKEWLRLEADRLKKQLEGSEQALEDYRKQTGVISLQERQDIVTPQLQDLNKRLTDWESARIQAEGAYKDWLRVSTNTEGLMALPEIAADPDIKETSAAARKSENEFAVIRQRYREKHPKYILAAASLDALREQLAITALKVRARIQEARRNAYQNDASAVQGLRDELRDTEAKALELSDSAVRFNVLSRAVESDRALYDSVINRLGETTLAAQITPERIRVIQSAVTPEKPASPKPALVFVLAIIGGLGAGVAISLLTASIDTSFRTAAEVERFLALPVLGTIHKLARAKGAKTVLVADNGHAAGEIFRTLRTNLSMLGREKNRRTFLFTSSLLSEGKTFTSINFAVSLAQQGYRTLLVDADLRRPMIEESLTGANNGSAGFTDFLRGHKKLNEICLSHEKIPNLFWIGGGSAVQDPGELVARADFQQLLDEALPRYDRIVIDTAPLLPVSDTLHLASKAQTVVLVVQGCKTSRQGVERSVRLLQGADAHVAGVVLNLLPNRLFSGYYYSYYNSNGHEAHAGKQNGRSHVNA